MTTTISITTDLKPIKKLISYAAVGRFHAEVGDRIAETPRRPEIRSPYAYSPLWSVYSYKSKPVVLIETSHRNFVIYEVPANTLLAPKQDGCDA